MSSPTGSEMKFPGLSGYLSQIRAAVFNTSSVPPQHDLPWTLIMGNPSADLDSFISAITLSYFYNANARLTRGRERFYIPVLNLPHIPASELWRLRPEFGVALKLANGGVVLGEDQREREKKLLGELVTVSDVRAREPSRLYGVFEEQSNAPDEKQELILVDHNAPAMPGLSDEQIREKFEVVGCIDHHVDESYVDSSADPRIVRTGIGSCTSLVVKHLKEEGMWPVDNASKEVEGLAQVARLALAPILIDTTKLTASGDKCSDIDREMVAFLEKQVYQPYERTTLFEAISEAKFESLSLLTIPEILDHDYKEWTELTKSGNKIKIGTSSVWRRLTWLVEHGEGVNNLIDQLEIFAKEHDLGCLCILTMLEKKRELALFAFDKTSSSALSQFEANAQELKLASWSENEQLRQEFETRSGKNSCHIWRQGDTSKSRKQVAPLARQVIKAS